MRWLDKLCNNYAATDWDALKLITIILGLLAFCLAFAVMK